MRPSKDLSLIFLVIAATVAMAVVRELRFSGYLSTQTQIEFAFVVFGLNIIAAIMGIIWTTHRRAWYLHLALTAACMILLARPQSVQR